MMENISDISTEINRLAKQIVMECTRKHFRIATAESCTGGMVSAAVTGVSGSSAVIELGICSYSNRIKTEVLGVSSDTLERCTEYSLQCAEEMALGVLRMSGADFAVSTTGVAGPGGGNEEHPVGEVFVGIASKKFIHAERLLFNGNRSEVRLAACCKALEMLIAEIEKENN